MVQEYVVEDMEGRTHSHDSVWLFLHSAKVR